MLSRSRSGWSRRRFVGAGLVAAAAPVFGGCNLPSEQSLPARLTARPGTPTFAPVVGASPLGLGSGRDGVLFVPTSLDPAVPAPLMVALHGAGGSGSAWVNYQVRAEVRGAVLLAPDSRLGTWDMLAAGLSADLGFIDRALAHTFARCRIDPAHIALAGFSDGASYTLGLGLSNGDLFTHLIAFSPGFMPLSDPLVGRPKIFVSHGTSDFILPVTASRDTIVPNLRAAGYDTTYVEFAGGHEVPATVGDAAFEWWL